MEQAALFCSSPEKQQLSIYKFSHWLNRTSFCNCQCWRTGILLQGTWNGISASVHTQFPWTALLLSQSNLGHDDSLWMLSKKHPTACSVQSVLSGQVLIAFLQRHTSVCPKHGTREFLIKSLPWKPWFCSQLVLPSSLLSQTFSCRGKRQFAGKLCLLLVPA